MNWNITIVAAALVWYIISINFLVAVSTALPA